MEKISAVLIVKNEEKILERCLRSLEGVDQIVVHDTGSTDGTVALAKALGADVSVGEPIVPFHFAQARNRANTFAAWPWILSMDADETLGRDSLEMMRTAVYRDKEADAVVPTFLLHKVGGGAPARTEKIKLFRKDRWTWKYRVHEQLVPTGDVVHIKRLPEAVIQHIPLEDKEARRGQNLELLRLSVKEDPEYIRNFRQLALELFLKKEYEEALPHMVHFLGKVPDTDPMEKSDALTYVARCHVGSGRLDEALPWFERAAKAAHFRREPLWWAALALISAARLDEAKEYLERLLRIPAYLKPGSHTDQDIWDSTLPEEALGFCVNGIAEAKARWEAR